MRLRRRPLAVDAGVAVLLCGLDVVLFLDPGRSSGVFGGSAAPWYAGAGFLLLLWRRRFPVVVLTGMVAHSLLAWPLSPGYVPTLGVWLALYTVAARSRRGTASAVFGVGRWAGWTARHKSIVAQRAALDAVLAERRRIARDLHDVAAHAVTLMVLQAGGAARHVRTDPARALAALARVDTLGQQAIRELQQLLGMLASGDEAAVAPVSIHDVDQLVAGVTTEDLPVRLTTAGEPVALDVGVDVSVGRILQEALTNAVRYADRHTPVEVTVSWLQDHLHVAVSNEHRRGARGGRHSLGRGVIGMQERARAIGAELSVGPGPGGTFVVAVRLQVTRSVPLGPRTPQHALGDRGDGPL